MSNQGMECVPAAPSQHPPLHNSRRGASALAGPTICSLLEAWATRVPRSECWICRNKHGPSSLLIVSCQHVSSRQMCLFELCAECTRSYNSVQQLHGRFLCTQETRNTKPYRHESHNLWQILSDPHPIKCADWRISGETIDERRVRTRRGCQGHGCCLIAQRQEGFGCRVQDALCADTVGQWRRFQVVWYS